MARMPTHCSYRSPTHKIFLPQDVFNNYRTIRNKSIMDSKVSSSLSQPWKSWYTPANRTGLNPLVNPKPLNGKGQGSLPRKPRHVDLSVDKTPKN
ncbi:hypothetical protein CC78DRAFT_586155 [Lojkania enalia]|uniref:Uncharacterized protein n=1 Tax=Lojkania enalia TaxID=147567 RepID=A0A9P4N201_9PLEO|nr:hypothetical protein CC78DRAFT_586155 [Didymosphaeria enalia]